MDTEFEIKVLDINVEVAKQTLESLGFKAQPTITFRRYVYDVSEQPKMWLRLRTDGVKTTLTLKKFESDTIDGMKELEFKLDDFDTANKLVTELGFTNCKYQENRRTNYVSEAYDAEISIDEWPKIPTYLEIEAKSEAIVQELLAKLNTDKLPTTSQPTDAVYKKYDLDINSYPSLSF